MRSDTPPPFPRSFAIRPGRVTAVLALTIAMLLLAHDAVEALAVFTAHDRLLGIASLFDLDAEQNVPTLFSCGLIFFNAGLCGLVWRLARSKRDREPGWLILAIALLVVGTDEFCSFHESLVTPLRHAFHLAGIFYFAWVIPYAAGTAVLGATLLPLLWRLKPRVRWMMMASGVVYVFGAVGLEMLGGWLLETMPNKHAPLWMLASTFEELLEMSGMTLFCYTMLDVLVREYGVSAVQLQFGAGAG